MTGDGWTTARITHIAERDAWEAASESSPYTAPSLALEGFIHCSTPWQVVRIASVNFAGRDDLVLLVIDPREVGADIVFENCEGGFEPFPHIYGPLPVRAVTAVHDLVWDSGSGAFTFPVGYAVAGP